MVIHETAIVAPDTVLGAESHVGPYAVVGIDRSDLAPISLGASSTVRSHTVLYRGTKIGERCAFGHGVLVREECTIGSDVSIGSHTVVEHNVSLRDRVRLHSGCFVPEESILEEGAWLGPGVIVTNARYPNRPDTKSNLEGVHIGAGAVVGAGVIMLPGVQIGAGAMIGAGAVVVKDVADGTRVVGTPARTLP